MLSLYDELKGLTIDLAASGIEYAVCGGLAMAIHTLPRATVDIDLLILTNDLNSVLQIARARGFTLSAKPMTFAEGKVEIRRVSKPDPEIGDVLMLDLLLVTAALNEVWEGREAVLWEGETLQVVSREGLIALKRLRFSGQDQDDIKRLRGEL
jgi:hypothetical protein